MDLIYEGITTRQGLNKIPCLVRMDLIYEGITTALVNRQGLNKIPSEWT